MSWDHEFELLLLFIAILGPTGRSEETRLAVLRLTQIHRLCVTVTVIYLVQERHARTRPWMPERMLLNDMDTLGYGCICWIRPDALTPAQATVWTKTKKKGARSRYLAPAKCGLFPVRNVRVCKVLELNSGIGIWTLDAMGVFFCPTRQLAGGTKIHKRCSCGEFLELCYEK